MAAREDIQTYTCLFRTSIEPLWIRLREVVSERGVDPGTALLVESFEDDENFEFGILVTDDRRVIQFGFRYSVPSGIDGKLSEWNDITERRDSLPCRHEIATALSILDDAA